MSLRVKTLLYLLFSLGLPISIVLYQKYHKANYQNRTKSLKAYKSTFPLSSLKEPIKLDKDLSEFYKTVLKENNQILENFDFQERAILKNILVKVQKEVKKNPMIIIDYDHFLSKREYDIVARLRVYRHDIRKNTNRELFSRLILNLTSEQIVDLYLGIK